MRLDVIACDVLLREVCSVAAKSPHTINLRFLPKGLHDRQSADMLRHIQSEVDHSAECDAVVLVYALCGNGLSGLRAPRIPVVIPRAHDCITLFLGSRERYRQYFDEHPGTYFRTPGWIERGSSTTQLGGFGTEMQALVAKYGHENAVWLYEQMHGYEKTYSHLTYIQTGVVGASNEAVFEQRSRTDADALGWRFNSIEGDLVLIESLLNGQWDSGDFVVLQPGEVLAPTWDDRVVESRRV